MRGALGLCGLGLALALAALHPVCAQSVDLRARGVVRSLGEASISSELPARIIAMPFREGESFRKGERLVEFDCVRFAAEVAGLEAEMAAARAAHDGNLDMQRFKAIGARDLAISSARLDKASADVEAGKSRLAACVIIAPFDGVVVEKLANIHEISSPSAPLLRVVDVSRLEIELIAPSRWLGWASDGAAFDFEIDETGHTHRARVTRLGPVVEPVSQTVKFFGVLEDVSPEIRPGMSGTARFARTGD